ncbi:hypothetical protein L9F63_017189, partial [Diploptera punctata]
IISPASEMLTTMVHWSTDRRKKKTAKKRPNTSRPEATDDGDKLRNCSLEEKGYE